MKGRRLLEYYKLQTGKLLLTFLLKDTWEHRTLSPSMFLFFDNFDATVKRNSAKIIAVPNFHDVHVLLLQSCI